MALEPAKDRDDYLDAIKHVHDTVTRLHYQHQEQLPLWVVFGPGTTDNPGMYLARMWLTLPRPQMTNLMIRANSLEEIYDLLPPGLTALARSPQDDANIIETWF